VDVAALRSRFPVLERVAYLNAGTCGPIPSSAADAARDAWLIAAREGRSGDYYDRLMPHLARLRAEYAGLLGADTVDVSITTSTSDGIGRVLVGLDLEPGDEVLTAPDEHPGLLGALIAARERRGIVVRTAPLSELAEAAGPATKLIACSHVAWSTGETAPAELAELDVPLLLDGAQGIGAIPVDVAALGCDFYAASGQKWLCGPIGTGSLWISPQWRERVAPGALAYGNLEEPGAGLGTHAFADARRHDSMAVSLDVVLPALASLDTLGAAGWPAVHERSARLASSLAAQLAERGRVVAPRGETTLVSWESPDPSAEVERLAAAGVVVRAFPGLPFVRASVGAWNGESDLERLLTAL
jgi:selenocysteine lyase/cysteine desulfurase